MMPSSKEHIRHIYIAALIISFLLIIGSICLHLRQKTHLGRMSFSLDSDRIRPTSGVETSTWMAARDSRFSNETDEHPTLQDDGDEEIDAFEASSPEDEYIPKHYTNSGQVYPSDSSKERNKGNDKTNHDEDVEDIVPEPTSVHQNSDYEIRSLEQDSNACLRCLCMTVNQCRPTFCGSGNPCGLYQISKWYWIDGGRPTISGGSTDNEDQDYLTCVNEDSCSAAVIHQYYDRYKRDCNKDGVINCQDQIALHILGPNGCLTENLSYTHAKRMRNCLIESNLNYSIYSSEEEYGQYL